MYILKKKRQTANSFIHNELFNSLLIFMENSKLALHFNSGINRDTVVKSFLGKDACSTSSDIRI